MKILGIAGVLRRKTTRTTIADPTAQRFPDRIQRAWSQAQRPDQWWVADFGPDLRIVDASGVRPLHTKQEKDKVRLPLVH